MKSNHSPVKLGLPVNRHLNELYNEYCKEFGYVKHTRMEYLLCIDLILNGYITTLDLEGNFSPEQIQRVLNEQAHIHTSTVPIHYSTPATLPPTNELSERSACSGKTQNT